MRIKIITYTVAALLLLKIPGFSFYTILDFNFLGTVLNDSFYMKPAGEDKFNNILETRLVVERDTDEEADTDWKVYFDGRAYLYYGDIVDEEGRYDLKLMRGFLRYFSSIGDFTLGKTYINFGNPGLFNPFETDKDINLSDLNYDREGIPALEYDFPLTDFSDGKIYVGSDNYFEEPLGGTGLSANMANFDFGIIANRLGKDSNITGIYFKGDLELGLQGSWGYHMNDELKKIFNEANFGIDYSFFQGVIVIDTMLYYNQLGAAKINDYSISDNSYLLARYYLYGSVHYIYDEFINGQLLCFANLVDGSAIISHILNVTIIDGLTVTIQLSVPSGKGQEEFSRDSYGDYIAMLRVEGKF